MILAPNNGSVGIQPSGTKCRCINRQGSALAVGDVVVTSYAHSGALYPPADTVASLELSPLSCVVKADGSPTSSPGFVGVVTGLLSGAGADASYVEVQFGGIANAKVNASGASIDRGSGLVLSDTAGQFANAGGGTPTVGLAIALGACADGSSATIPVILPSVAHFPLSI